MNYLVKGKENGARLLDFLSNKIGESFSKKQIKFAIDNNLCTVNGKVERFSTKKLLPGDEVAFEIELFQKLQDRKQRVQFEQSRVLFEDEFLFIYNKPAYVTSEQVPVKHALVHRLDRDTSGILVFAKTEEAKKAMEQLFHDRLIQKQYLAVADGGFTKHSGVVDNYLGVIRKFEGQSIWGAVKQKGFHAVTEWSKMLSGKKATLLLCKPKTGRTHQLRVHLSGMGHPILGDFQYGKQFVCSYRPMRILLHAWQLLFEHPITKQPMGLKASPPDDFQNACIQLFGKCV